MNSKNKLQPIRQRLRIADQVEMELEAEDAEVAWAFLGPMGYEVKVARLSERHYWVVGCVNGIHRAAALSKLFSRKRLYKVGGSIDGKCFCHKPKLSIVGIFFSLKNGATKIQAMCRTCDKRHIIKKGHWPESEDRWRH